ncbi:MAG: endonuclease [Planctomycetota bacterium]
MSSFLFRLGDVRVGQVLAALLCFLCFDLSSIHAGPYDPPANYYNSATGTGSTLKSQLHNIIDAHTVRSYNAARSLLQITDQDPNDPDRMILVYDRISLDVSAINPNGSIPGWDSAATWNREHTWPRSRGVDSSGPDNSDLHQLRPSTTQVNSDRDNLNFGGAFGAQNFGTVFDQGSLKWYPGDADAGMIARQQFYMATRYDNSDSSTDDLEIVDGNPGIGGSTLGDLDRLIEWHFAAPPDEFELRRNDVIYDDYQGNRNPFIDRPEYVWSVFVDQQNDTRLAIDGTNPGSDGGSSMEVDLGRVLIGAPVPSSQGVTINKTGVDGTYYSVAAAGLATSTMTEGYHAFRTGASGSATLQVGLDTNTTSAGSRSGSVTIDNLDVTTAGGAGRGANDADDVIDITLEVLDHANPSFAVDSNQDLLVHDFGTIAEGSTSPMFEFDIFNLESTLGFTAGLQLDQIVGFGDALAFQTDFSSLLSGTPVVAGSGATVSATLNTSVPGEFSSSYLLSFSDEDLPGASALGTIEVMLSGTVEAAVSETADFNEDGDVDGSDYLAWQRGLAAGATLAEGDSNGDMTVDSLDLSFWRDQYASVAATRAIASVPEPSAAVLLLAAMLLLLNTPPRQF